MRPKASTKIVLDKAKLKDLVLAHCELARAAIGYPLWPRDPDEGAVPEEETRAQEAFAEARRAVNRLLSVAKSGRAQRLKAGRADGVCGPCTSYLEQCRGKLEALAAEAEWQNNHRWRPHSAKRNSNPTTWAVDFYSRLRSKGTSLPQELSPGDIAIYAILARSPLKGDSVAACIQAETERVREAMKRAERKGRPTRRLPGTA